MKLRVRDRIVSAVLGVMVMAAAVAALLYATGVLAGTEAENLLNSCLANCPVWLTVVVCILLFLVGLCGVAMLFRRRKDKGFVLQHTEYGDMSISMKALANMVKQCVESHPELTVTQTRIEHFRGGVTVEMKITLASGINIPLTVNALQKQIKQYITSCSGVDVHEIRVLVETDMAKLLPAPETAVVEPVVVEAQAETVEKAAECLCMHREEPQTYAEAPVQETALQEEAAAEPEIAEEEAETAVEAAEEEQPAEEAEEPEAELLEAEAEETEETEESVQEVQA